MFLGVPSSPAPETSSSLSPPPKSPASPYYAYNPDTFDEWKYRDLQELAKQLNLGAKGTRESLIEKLTTWHKKTIIHQDRAAPIQNFSMVPAKVKGATSARFLSPLTKTAARNVDGTPKGILSPLKRVRSWIAQPNFLNVEGSSSVTTIEEETVTVTEVEITSEVKKPRKSISFSVFNGVRLISPRQPRPASPAVPLFEPETDPDSLDFTGVDETESKPAQQPQRSSSPASSHQEPRSSPLETVRRVVSLPFQIPSFITSLLSPTAPPPSPKLPEPQPQSLADIPVFRLEEESPVEEVKFIVCVPPPEPASLPQPSQPMEVEELEPVPLSSISLLQVANVPVEPAPTPEKPIVVQEKWSAKERRARRSSFGEGRVDKENRLTRLANSRPSRASMSGMEQRPLRSCVSSKQETTAATTARPSRASLSTMENNTRPRRRCSLV